MGYTVGLIAEKKPFKSMMLNNILSVILAIVIKIVGYYFAEVILYGNWITPWDRFRETSSRLALQVSWFFYSYSRFESS